MNLSRQSNCDTIGRMTTLTSLYLAPADHTAAPSCEPVIEVLRRLDIIGPPLDAGSFAAGDGFSRHVIFAGCSPYLVMAPPADGSRGFCHVAVHGPLAVPRLVTGPNTTKPRCPSCRARFAGWATQIDAWRVPGARAHCDACGVDSDPHALDWRGHAISGRLLVELRNVFPGEAGPSDLLMASLQEATAQPWRHAWAAYYDA